MNNLDSSNKLKVPDIPSGSPNKIDHDEIKFNEEIKTISSTSLGNILPTNLVNPFQIHYPVNEMNKHPYYNPFLNHPQMTAHPSFNYLGNQGIFIPQNSKNNQFFFIPGNLMENQFKGNIPSITRNSESIYNDDIDCFKRKHSEESSNKDSILFVPSSGLSDDNDEDYTSQTCPFETYLVPVQITKETNGNIELLPENNYKNLPQPTNPEQIRILRKISQLKNQHLTKTISDPIINTDIENQEIIDGLKDKTQGYVMFRFHKTRSSNMEKSIEVISPEKIKLPYANSLQLSGPKKDKEVKVDGKKRTKSKKRPKTHKLKLSAILEKTTSPVPSTSRFRRLRVDDRTQCWNLGEISCIDTRMRELPPEIIKLSESNAINIPDEVFNLFKQKDINTQLIKESLPKCQHCSAKDPTDKDNESKNQFEPCRFHFLRYMCSMNNCEFIQPEKELI